MTKPKTTKTKKELYTPEELAETFEKCYVSLLAYNPVHATVRAAAAHAKRVCIAKALIVKGDEIEEIHTADQKL